MTCQLAATIGFTVGWSAAFIIAMTVWSDTAGGQRAYCLRCGNVHGAGESLRGDR